jgi:hypothetical protein
MHHADRVTLFWGRSALKKMQASKPSAYHPVITFSTRAHKKELVSGGLLWFFCGVS